MNSISQTCLAAIALLTASAASAADLPARVPPAPLMALPAFTWTGVYVGGQAGYTWGRDRTTEYLTATGAFTGLTWGYDANSFVGGVHAGANYQLGLFVIGGEGDLEAVNARGGFVDPGGLGELKLKWQSSLRARVGVAFDRLHIYGTGGAAFANMRYDYTNPVGPITETTTSWRTGYTIGGGAEFAFTDNLIGRVEYRYSNFGSFRYVSTVAFPILTGEQTPRFSTVRAGLSYKF
jgi:outer membrane immunogenic protein